MKDLGLQSQAERHLGFLVSERGFVCTESAPSCVRFVSPGVIVELWFDGNRSYELDLSVAMTTDAASHFSIGEILRARGAPEAKRLSSVQVTSSEALAHFVEEYAAVLRSHGDGLIKGDPKHFAEVAALRRRESEELLREQDLSIARANAEIAWHQKDYAAVVKVLEPVRAFLAPSERAKLELAKKRYEAPP